jgi:hypothetical protein
MDIDTTEAFEALQEMEAVDDPPSAAAAADDAASAADAVEPAVEVAAEPAEAAAKKCGACAQPVNGFHTCFLQQVRGMEHVVPLHSNVVCDSVVMPVDGYYFCSLRCVDEYNDYRESEGVSDVMPDGGPTSEKPQESEYLFPRRERPDQPVEERLRDYRDGEHEEEEDGFGVGAVGFGVGAAAADGAAADEDGAGAAAAEPAGGMAAGDAAAPPPLEAAAQLRPLEAASLTARGTRIVVGEEHGVVIGNTKDNKLVIAFDADDSFGGGSAPLHTHPLLLPPQSR